MVPLENADEVTCTAGLPAFGIACLDDRLRLPESSREFGSRLALKQYAGTDLRGRFEVCYVFHQESFR
jgi:hypothetical protein